MLKYFKSKIKSVNKLPAVKSSGVINSSSDGFFPMFLNAVTRTNSGVAINEQIALFNSAVFACQRAISESIAILPRHIYDKNGTNRIEVLNHPSKRLLTVEANPLMTSFSFFRTLVHHALSYGNGYAELEFDPGTGYVVKAWPLPASQVTPEVFLDDDKELNIFYRVIYSDGTQTILPKERVLHIPGIGFDGIRGYPLIHLMANVIGLSDALSEYGATFFKQGANTPGYVTVADNVTDEQLKNMRRQVDINNAGLSNAHRVNFLYESLKFTPSGVKPTDSQMLESRVFQIQEIARFYRMPLHKIQELSKAPNHNSLETFNNEFYSDTLTPWTTPIEQEINRKFFNEPKDSEKYIKFNFSALLRADSATRSAYYRTMVMSGIMTTNEVRALEDLPPIDGGNERMTPLNMTNGSDKELDAKERIQD